MKNIISLLDQARDEIARLKIPLDKIHEVNKLIGMAEIKIRGYVSIENKKSERTLLKS